MGRLKNGLSMRFLMELEMGPFPTELCKENRAVSLQPRGARDGTRTHDLRRRLLRSLGAVRRDRPRIAPQLLLSPPRRGASGTPLRINRSTGLSPVSLDFVGAGDIVHIVLCTLLLTHAISALRAKNSPPRPFR